MTLLPVAKFCWSHWRLMLGCLLLTGCGLINPIPGPDLIHLRSLIWNETAGQVLWVSGGSTSTTQIAIAQTGQMAALCTQSSDRRLALVAYGDAHQHLVLLNGDPSAPPVDLGETDPGSCLRGHSVFSTDSSQLIYLSYSGQTTPAAGTASAMAVGTLNMLSLPTSQSQVLLDQVTAFDLQGIALLALSGSGTELTPQQWTPITADGKVSAPHAIGAPLLPPTGCTWVDAQIRAIGTTADKPDHLLAALAERCGTSAAETVHLFSIPLSSGSATEIYHQSVNGTYDPSRLLGALATTPDEKTAYIAVPNGQTPDLSDVLQIDLTKPLQYAPTVARGVYLARSGLNASATQWALVLLNAGGGETLEILDLNHPDEVAVILTDNNRSSLIPGMTWSQSGKRLIYVYTGNNSTLGYLDLNGSLASVLPGNFRFAVTDSAGKVALTVKADSGDLLAVAIPAGGAQTLITGKPGVKLVPLALVNSP